MEFRIACQLAGTLLGMWDAPQRLFGSPDIIEKVMGIKLIHTLSKHIDPRPRNIFQVFPIDQYKQFRQALEYQQVSKFGYFDLLVLTESDQGFIDQERTYFSR